MTRRPPSQPPAVEVPLLGGTANRGRVHRVGTPSAGRCARPAPATHALLRHLEEVGFDGAPAACSASTSAGREVLSYVPGRGGHRARPPAGGSPTPRCTASASCCGASTTRSPASTRARTRWPDSPYPPVRPRRDHAQRPEPGQRGVPGRPGRRADRLRPGRPRRPAVGRGRRRPDVGAAAAARRHPRRAPGPRAAPAPGPGRRLRRWTRAAGRGWWTRCAATTTGCTRWSATGPRRGVPGFAAYWSAGDRGPRRAGPGLAGAQHRQRWPPRCVGRIVRRIRPRDRGPDRPRRAARRSPRTRRSPRSRRTRCSPRSAGSPRTAEAADAGQQPGTEQRQHAAEDADAARGGRAAGHPGAARRGHAAGDPDAAGHRHAAGHRDAAGRRPRSRPPPRSRSPPRSPAMAAQSAVVTPSTSAPGRDDPGSPSALGIGAPTPAGTRRRPSLGRFVTAEPATAPGAAAGGADTSWSSPASGGGRQVTGAARTAGAIAAITATSSRAGRGQRPVGPLVAGAGPMPVPAAPGRATGVGDQLGHRAASQLGGHLGGGRSLVRVVRGHRGQQLRPATAGSSAGTAGRPEQPRRGRLHRATPGYSRCPVSASSSTSPSA